MMDWLERLILWAIGIGMAILLIALAHLLYVSLFTDYYALPKTEWTCTVSQKVKVTRIFWSGKTAIPVEQTETRCVRYDRIA